MIKKIGLYLTWVGSLIGLSIFINYREIKPGDCYAHKESESTYAKVTSVEEFNINYICIDVEEGSSNVYSRPKKSDTEGFLSRYKDKKIDCDIFEQAKLEVEITQLNKEINLIRSKVVYSQEAILQLNQKLEKLIKKEKTNL